MLEVKFEELLGKTITEILAQAGGDTVKILTSDGQEFQMWHSQDCCETVILEDVVGDIQDLIGNPVLKAEERTNDERPCDLPKEEWPDESCTWTFYELATVKGSVTLRWHGSSNGCYSESVEFGRVK